MAIYVRLLEKRPLLCFAGGSMVIYPPLKPQYNEHQGRLHRLFWPSLTRVKMALMIQKALVWSCPWSWRKA